MRSEVVEIESWIRESARKLAVHCPSSDTREAKNLRLVVETMRDLADAIQRGDWRQNRR